MAEGSNFTTINDITMSELNKEINWLQVGRGISEFVDSSIEENSDLGLLLLVIGMNIFLSCIVANLDDKQLIIDANH